MTNSGNTNIGNTSRPEISMAPKPESAVESGSKKSSISTPPAAILSHNFRKSLLLNKQCLTEVNDNANEVIVVVVVIVTVVVVVAVVA
eukprot:Pgem_evm1s7315